jgi:DNA-binding MarR family transcriptional regulator
MNLEPPQDGTTQRRLRPISKALFHSDFALEAFILIAQEDRFYKGQVAKVTGCQPNYAGDFLRRLESHGLIERVPQEEGQTRHYY